MQKDINQELISNIVKLSESDDNVSDAKIIALINTYCNQKKLNNKITDEKKDKITEQQSRFAAMGEMIDAVAHQWKQPLNAISMIVDILNDDFKNGNVDNDYIDDLDFMIHMQVDHMVNTLNEFRSFLRPSTKNENFHLNTIIQTVQILMRDELITQNLHINLDINEGIKIFGNKNEFKHLFINLINNSIDAFNEQNISNRELYIRCYKKEKYIYIEIEDNAKGIPINIINHVFKPNITTKAEGKGTGIGLYMSSQIVTKNHGSISVHNSKMGAFFTIILHEKTL